MKKFLFSLALMLAVGMMTTNAQTYCYKFMHNVTSDGVKKKGVLNPGTLFYFTFNNNKSMCFLTDKNGIYNGGYGQNSYRYIGKRNGMFIFKEQNTNMFAQGQDILYFSDDFERMNWKCKFDNFGSTNDPGTRVLKYVEDPDYDEIPNELY
ncbi:MAG: hypothetical protein IJ844_03940 [Prevotella sp.]|nr:hypothetical protein [Prevotella sp.]